MPLRRRALLSLPLAPALGGAAAARAGSPHGAGPAAAVGAPAAPRAVTLALWTMQLSPFHDDYVLPLLRRFEARHPGVRVRWVDVPWAEMERKVLASVAAGTPPDVVNLNPQFSARLAEFGALADPRPHLSAEEEAAFLPAAWAANALGGVPFALPWYLSTTVTLFRRDLLQPLGLAPPRDFADLSRCARALRQARPGATDGGAEGHYAWFPAMDGAAPMETLVAMTGALLTPDGCAPAFDSPAGVAAFEFHRTLLLQRWVPPAVLTEGHRGAVAQFLAGQVAMVSTGMQFIGNLRAGNPALHARVGVAPQVAAAGVAPNIAAMNLAVPRSSREPALAFRLAQFITDAGPQAALARRVPLLPSTRASYDEPPFAAAAVTAGAAGAAGALNGATAAADDPLLAQARAISVQQVQAGRVQVPPLRRYHKLRSSFVRGLQSAMVGRQPPAAAVAEVARTWRVLLGCAA
jgi:putative chitobiose transport system substrate-binding protein